MACCYHYCSSSSSGRLVACTDYGCVAPYHYCGHLFMFYIIYAACVCAAKLVPLAYGIKKLQIACVVEDDKVRLTV